MKKDMNTIQDDIIRQCSQLTDWFETYDFLIKKAKSFELEDESVQLEEHAIGGCQSSVWIKAEEKQNKMHYISDSDSLIIKGILSLLMDVVNDQAAEDIVNADFYFLDKIGLRSHLSPSRTNGLNAIINQLKEKASQHSKQKSIQE